MKKIFATVLLFLFIVGCSEDEHINVVNSQSEKGYLITVVKEDGTRASGVNLLISTEDGDIFTKCNKQGFISLKSEKSIRSVICATLGNSGFTVVENGSKNIEVKLEGVQKLRLAKIAGTYGVYSTDGSGDVSFKYQGNFSSYYCTSSMPAYLPGWNPIWQNTDPNTWGGWNLNDWLPTWKGKKLLVPGRCQWYHQSVYGFSISQALFVITN